MAHLEDQQGWISAFMHGAGAPAYGPIPAYPQSPYLPVQRGDQPVPVQHQHRVSLLKSHGWTVAPAARTSARARAAVPASAARASRPGTKLKCNLIYSTRVRT